MKNESRRGEGDWPRRRSDGKKLPAVQYDVRDWSFIVMFDPETGLPARIRTLDPTRYRATPTTISCSPTGVPWAG